MENIFNGNLFWIDPKIQTENHKNQINEISQKYDLNLFFHEVKGDLDYNWFNNLDDKQKEEFLLEIFKKYNFEEGKINYLITSGLAGKILNKINYFNKINIYKLYIFCGDISTHSQWAEKLIKISKVEDDFFSLLSYLEIDINNRKYPKIILLNDIKNIPEKLNYINDSQIPFLK